MATLLGNVPGIAIAAQAWRKNRLKISVDRSIHRQATNADVFTAIKLAVQRGSD